MNHLLQVCPRTRFLSCNLLILLLALLLQDIQIKGKYLNWNSKNALKRICFLAKLNKLADLLNTHRFLTGFQTNIFNGTVKFESIINCYT